MYQNIPAELQALPQWLCWRYEIIDGRQTKVPYNVRTAHHASIQNPATWCTFQEALNAVHYYSGIGMVLTDDDPYTGIDIDNKPENPASEDELKAHAIIRQTFQSYTEESVGGSGCHIIIRGKVKGGRDRGHVGIYSTARYLTFTGKVILNAPIVDYQEMLTLLYDEMTPVASVELEDHESHLTDTEVFEMATNAVNADKYNALCAGDMTGYPSQSEADFALLAILAFYTRDNEQVRRLFRMTALGKRDKAVRDNNYLNFALGKIRAQQPASINMADLLANATLVHQPPVIEEEDATYALPPEELIVKGITLPPGIIGELAQYIYQSAIRPVPEIALLAAMALVAGIAGRSYNIQGMGLNHYLVLLAKTGTGKEGARSGIEKMIACVRPTIPIADQFIGPARFGSGQGLIRKLSDQPCFVSVLGEFGITLQQLTDPRASDVNKAFKQALLDLYNQSGWQAMLRPSVYSDTEKNTKMVQAPCLTILGESTPESFFEGLDSGHIADGLIPRFIILEYEGLRPDTNPNYNMPPPAALMTRFSDLIVAAMTTTNSGKVTQVEQTPDAAAMLLAYDKETTAYINAKACTGPLVEIWNRAYQNVVKVSALVAVGVNPYAPVVTTEYVQWAKVLVELSVKALAKRFSDGNIGNGDSKQWHDLKHIVEAYSKARPDQLKGYGSTLAMQKAAIYPYRYFMRKTSGLPSFKNDKMGATMALKRTLQSMVESGYLLELNKADLSKNFQFSGVAYGIGNSWS